MSDLVLDYKWLMMSNIYLGFVDKHECNMYLSTAFTTCKLKNTLQKMRFLKLNETFCKGIQSSRHFAIECNKYMHMYTRILLNVQLCGILLHM